MLKAALFVGGWEGHKPSEFCAWALHNLAKAGFSVDAHDAFAPLLDPAYREGLDLIVPIWSSARSSHQQEFGNISRKEELALLQAVANGCGIAGWHGHMGDAFRDHPQYHFMIGGQFVAHPPGWPDNPVPSDDFVDFTVQIKNKTDDPIVEGIQDFTMHTEQYYMLVDPSNEVLASTVFSGEHLPWLAGTEIPVIWRRTWANGRVFYCSLGHTVEDLNHPTVNTLLQRGFLWAARDAARGQQPIPKTLQSLFQSA